MNAYYGVFLPIEEGGYMVLFKDYPDVVSQGRTEAECVLMGDDAISMRVAEDIRNGVEPPAQSTYEECAAFAEERMKEDGMDGRSRAVVHLFVVPNMDTRVIRTSISLRQYELDMVDRRAKLFGYSRSEFFVLAARTYRDISEELGE